MNQIKQWASYAESHIAPSAKNQSLVVVWIGINDILDTASTTFPCHGVGSFMSLYQKILYAEFEALEAVWDKGYQNYLFLQLPPLDKSVRGFFHTHESS